VGTTRRWEGTRNKGYICMQEDANSDLLPALLLLSCPFTLFGKMSLLLIGKKEVPPTLLSVDASLVINEESTDDFKML